MWERGELRATCRVYRSGDELSSIQQFCFALGEMMKSEGGDAVEALLGLSQKPRGPVRIKGDNRGDQAMLTLLLHGTFGEEITLGR